MIYAIVHYNYVIYILCYFYVNFTLAEGKPELRIINVEDVCKISSSCVVKQGQSNLRYCELGPKNLTKGDNASLHVKVTTQSLNH